MTSWLTKAKAHFTAMRKDPAPETTETGVMGVLVVSPLPVYEKHAANEAQEDALLQELLAEAERVCDHLGDTPQAKAQMRQEVLALAKEQWSDLLEHFLLEYPRDGEGAANLCNEPEARPAGFSRAEKTPLLNLEIKSANP